MKRALPLASLAMLLVTGAFSAAMLSSRDVAFAPTFPAPAPGTGEPGRVVYMHHCAACHGERGDGRGPAAETMRPPPRDFTSGLFKFTATPHGQLPSDAALRRTISRGLEGTPMRSWDLTPEEVDAVIAYLKTLSPRWKEEPVPPEVELSRDPWAGRDADAIALGDRVFNLAEEGGGCALCHAREPALKESSYGVKVLPTVFGLHAVKTVSPASTPAEQREDLYRVIATGVGNSAMPGWKDVVSEEKLWALTYYVQSLMKQRP